ncbi:hypothetical protein NQD34_002201 [Periophthalmus magnuspinnatus]|nr:hypothetical protein NQD34_002201 [Periophthalmus magnuspinnatus]
MGSFAGHVLPGGMLLFLGLWWGIKFSMFQLTQKNKNRKWQLISRSNQRRLEIFEGFILIVFASVGVVSMQIAGAKVPLYDNTENHWSDMMNLQHCTIFMFFELAGAMTLLVHTTEAVPLALDRLVLGLAFLNKGLLISYHIHGQMMVDVTVHQLLVYIIYVDALILFLEVFHRGNITLELMRSTVSIVQGSWYWQIGFVLCPQGPQWDLSNHSNMMFVVMFFSWHLMFALLFTGLVYCTVSWLGHTYKPKYIRKYDICYCGMC